MGRHESGETTGPFKRIRHDDPTIPIPSAEVTKRRAWPVLAIFALMLVVAVGLPLWLSNLSAEESPTRERSAVSIELSPSPDPSPSPSPSAVPVPTVTVTKNRIEYKTKTPAPAPTETKTIYRTPPASVITVPKPVTLKPKPAPTVTETETIYEDRCYRVRDGIMRGEIECP